MAMSRHFAIGDHELVLHKLCNGGLMIEIDPDTQYYRMVEADPQQTRRILSYLRLPPWGEPVPPSPAKVEVEGSKKEATRGG